MDIRTYYKINRKKPLPDKIDALIESMYWFGLNRYHEGENAIRQNRDTELYYKREALHMNERIRLMRGLIMQELPQ